MKKFALILWLLLTAAPAFAQTNNNDVGRSIGRAIAAGVVLTFDDFATSGHYTVDSTERTSFEAIDFSYRHRFRPDHDWQPILGAAYGQVEVSERMGIGDSKFDLKGVALEGGARWKFRPNWYAETIIAIERSDVKQRLNYIDAATEMAQGPLLNGIVVNWSADAWTIGTQASLGMRRPLARGKALLVEAQSTFLQTDPTNTQDSVQDVSVETSFQRLTAGIELPLHRELFGRPLRFDARLRHSFFDNDLRQALDSSRMTELRVDLVALRPDSSNSKIPSLGIAATYTQSDAFDGWAIGLTLVP